MPAQKSPARLAALRVLAEGGEPSLAVLADASGWSLDRVAAAAKAGAWAIAGSEQERTSGRVRAAIAGLVEKAEAIAGTLAEGGQVEKGEIDTLLAMMRALEKIDEITRPAEAAANNQRENDDRLAEILQSINDRVLSLAAEIAADMVAQRDRV